MMNYRFGIREKVMITMALLTIVPVIIMSTVSMAAAKDTIMGKMEQINASNMVILNQQMTNKLELLSTTLHGLPDSQSFQDCLNEMQQLQTKSFQLHQKLSSEMYSARNLANLGIPCSYILLLHNGVCYSDVFAVTASPTPQQVLKQESWYQKLPELNYTKTRWVSMDNLAASLGGKMLYVVSNLVVNEENCGIMMLGVSETYFKRILKSSKITENSRIFLCSADGSCVIGSDDSEIAPEILTAGENTIMEVDGSQYMFLTSTISLNANSGKWKLQMLVPVSDMKQEVSYLNTLAIVLVVACCGVILVMMLCINRWLVRPVMELSDSMYRVQHGDLTARSSVSSRDEIGMLAVGFNDMVEAMDNSIARVRKDQEIKHKMEMQLLHEQINPHFIRNTLNTVRWMAELKGAVGISKAINAFIGMINYSFERMNTFVPLKDELWYLEQYIYIQKLRYQNLFIYRTEIAPELLEARVPKLLLQPIVENSILHGIAQREEMGQIVLTAMVKDGDLVLSVWDNGIGISQEKIADILHGVCRVSDRGSSHIGLYNILERIRLYYGRDDLHIESQPGSYTRVTVRIPFQTGGNCDRRESDDMPEGESL